MLVGLSAGGLSSLLAAHTPGVVGYVGLDPFDRTLPDEAERLGLDWKRAPMAQANTANGTVPAHTLQLGTVRIGELVLNNVGAVVLPAQLPHVLLGNTFLSRVSMKRDNDTLKLEPKR